MRLMNRDELCLSVYPLTLRDGGGGDGDGGGGGGDGDGDGGGCTFRIGEGRVWVCASPSSLVDDILNMLGGQPMTRLNRMSWRLPRRNAYAREGQFVIAARRDEGMKRTRLLTRRRDTSSDAYAPQRRGGRTCFEACTHVPRSTYDTCGGGGERGADL